MFEIKKKISFSLSVAIYMAAGIAVGQDDINEPAGDIAEAQDDSEIEGSSDSDSSMSVESDPVTDSTEMSDGATDEFGSSPADMNMPEASEKNAGGENGEPIGPVWESYNESLKSVAQEVTKGLRVEDVVEPPTEYHYAAFGKPDPFIPPLIARREDAVASVSGLEVPIVSPLQRFDVNALRLVGIWQLPSGERKALILTPVSETSGEAGIIVHNGDSVGKRAGKILAIGDTFLTVREFKLAADGTRQYEDIQMLMGNRDSNVPGKIKFTPGEADTQIILEGQTTPQPTAGFGAGSPANRAAVTSSESRGPGNIGNTAAPAQPPLAGLAPAAPVAPVAPSTAPASAPATQTAAPAVNPSLTGVAPGPGQTITPTGNYPNAPVAGGGLPVPTPPVPPGAAVIPGQN